MIIRRGKAIKNIKKIILCVFCFCAYTNGYGDGIADVYWYEAKPGKVAEVEALMREGRDIAVARGQATIVHKQNIGIGGENRFL